VYPVVFGTELTPMLQGILIALLGVIGAFAIWNFLVKPVQTERNTLQGEVEQKEQQLQQQRAGLANRAELEAQLDQALNNRIGVYTLLGDAASLDTLLLDINQQINNSNAAISDVINANLNQANLNQTLQSIGFTQDQIQTIRNRIASNPNIQNYYASKLFQFDPEPAVLVQDGSLGPELNGKLERQQVAVSFQALFPQTQAILRNLERLEPLVIIRDFDQSIAPPGSGVSEEDLEGLFRPLNTNITLEVLVPVTNPAEPPPPPEAAPAEGEGEAPG
ncbi:hypothetical protein C7271_16415, partial [filamentous cyanobacterium CCP5]